VQAFSDDFLDSCYNANGTLNDAENLDYAKKDAIQMRIMFNMIKDLTGLGITVKSYK